MWPYWFVAYGEKERERERELGKRQIEARALERSSDTQDWSLRRHCCSSIASLSCRCVCVRFTVGLGVCLCSSVCPISWASIRSLYLSHIVSGSPPSVSPSSSVLPPAARPPSFLIPSLHLRPSVPAPLFPSPRAAPHHSALVSLLCYFLPQQLPLWQGSRKETTGTRMRHRRIKLKLNELILVAPVVGDSKMWKKNTR